MDGETFWGLMESMYGGVDLGVILMMVERGVIK